jgi:hypothetical protein
MLQEEDNATQPQQPIEDRKPDIKPETEHLTLTVVHQVTMTELVNLWICSARSATLGMGTSQVSLQHHSAFKTPLIHCFTTCTFHLCCKRALRQNILCRMAAESLSR